jgi:UDP-N-acetylglucosamine--N-acetylmuramyl-(pentapeptide) pyrophosphoryl-undecaprenol N-acetylglucosamine transferase
VILLKKIILTGGGTAGHVIPNLALIPELIKLGYQIVYIGSVDGIEKNLIEKINIKYYGIQTGKLRRYFDIKNFKDPFKVFKGISEASQIIKKEKPDVIFSKGGFVSVPVVIGGKLNGISVIAHESDITPGLANKIAEPFCRKICLTFPEALSSIKKGKGIITGTPIRKELREGSKLLGKKLCDFNAEKKVLMVMGGSQGSKVINNVIHKNIYDLLSNFNIIHICGRGNVHSDLTKLEGYKQFEYVDEELPHLMNYADFFISRAGANTIFELLYLNKPNILIPLSKKVSRGDQILNAISFKKQGFSIIIEEESLDYQLLKKDLEELQLKECYYVNNMKKSAVSNGIENVINVIQKYS